MRLSGVVLVVVITAQIIAANPVIEPKSPEGITPPHEEPLEPKPTTEPIAEPVTEKEDLSSAEPETVTESIKPVDVDKNKPNKEEEDPPKGFVTFDQRQHGKFNIRADLDNFVIVLIPQSTKSPPLFNLGGATSGILPGSGAGASILDLFTRQLIKRSQVRRKPYSKYKSQLRKKYKNELAKYKKTASSAEEGQEERVELSNNSVKMVEKEETSEPLNNLKESEIKSTAAGLAIATAPTNDQKGLDSLKEQKDKEGDKYRMQTLEKIERQLEVLLERVKAREAALEGVQQMEHFIEGRTPYRVDISSLHTDQEPRVDLIPSKNKPLPFRQFREEPILEIGTHSPPPKFYPQHWAFPSQEQQHQRAGPLMVAFRDARSLPQSDGNEIKSNSVQNQASNPQSRLLSDPILFDSNSSPILNEYIDDGFLDLTDTQTSFDSLNVDNVDRNEAFNQGWDLKLVGAEEDCGPDRKRDSYGICQFVPV